MTHSSPLAGAVRPVDSLLTLIVLAAIILVYLLLGTAYALRTPDWQAPDEPAHYNYTAQIAADGCCPVISLGDWDQAYLDELRANRFAPALLDRLPAVQYEDHQPPLYYALLAPLFNLTAGTLTVMRLASLLIGVGVIVSAFAVGRWIAPERPALGLAAAGIVALVPQNLAILSSMNNDSLSFALMGAACTALAVYMRRGLPAAVLGVIAGVGLLIKLNTLLLLGLFPLAILVRGLLLTADDGRLRRTARSLIVFFIVALGLAAPWWLRNVSVYGMPDLFGLGAHDAVVIGQLRTSSLIADIGANAYVQALAMTTFNSFWGQFGWMAAPLPGLAYSAIQAGIGLAVLGVVLRWGGLAGPLIHDPVRRATWGVLAVALIVSLAQYGYYNVTFVQFQGRYIFPGLIPFALMLAWGLEGLASAVRRGLRSEQPALTGLLIGLPIGGLIVLNVWVIWRVLPGLAP